MQDPVFVLDDEYLKKIVRGDEAAPEIAIEELTVQQASKLAQAVIDSKKIESLTVRVTEKGFSGLEKLLDELQGLSKPILLDLNNIVILPVHLQKITTLLKKNLLSGLDISNCKGDEQNLREIIESVSAATALASLNLTGCQIGDNGARTLAAQLKDHPSLYRINLYDNGITDPGIQVLAESFSTMKKLSCIKLGKNGLGTRGVVFLCDKLRQLDHPIEYLHLAHMKLPDETCAPLCRLIEENKLCELNAEGNWFSSTSLRRFATSVESSSTIIKLNLTANKFFAGHEGRTLPKLEQYPDQKRCLEQISARLKRNGEHGL